MPKKQFRVCRHEEFQSIIHNGKKVVNGSFVVHAVPRTQNYARVGISVAKKMGHAVDRNLFKRQVRMMVDAHINFQTFPYDLIVIVRFHYKELDFASNSAKFAKLVHLLSKD